jgi:hypothetical protein
VLHRAKLSPDLKHGQLHGRLVWKGRMAEKDEEIRSPLKKQWHLLEIPDYSKFKGDAEEIIKAVPPAPEQAAVAVHPAASAEA